MDRGQSDDGDDAADLGAVQRPPPAPDRGGREQMIGAEPGQDAAEILAEAHGDRGDGAGEDDGERRPAVEETPEGSPRLAQEDVDAAGARKHRTQLGVAERPRERQRAAGEPGDEDPSRRRQLARQHRRDEEDPGPDDAAERDRRRVPGAEPAGEARRRRGFRRRRCRLGDRHGGMWRGDDTRLCQAPPP